MLKFKKKEKLRETDLPISDESVFHISVPYEYPFSMNTKELRNHVSNFIERYNKIYRATNLVIYIQRGRYQNAEPSKIEDMENIINQGNNELSRRTNEKILKWSFAVAVITLCVAIVSCIVAITK